MTLTMKTTIRHIIAIAAMTAMLTACVDSPVDPYKPVDQRKILVVTATGKIYDQNHVHLLTLPDCDIVSEIISDGGDYFVSGTNIKGKVGYWKNGEWNTLHIDFIDDVEHFSSGIAKWDSYIFLFDYPNVLKNSGIFPLKYCESFYPAWRCMNVSEGKCYVVGSRTNHKLNIEEPILYSEIKGEYIGEVLPISTTGRGDSRCNSVFAYDRTHTLVCGHIDDQPALWVDKQLQILPCTYKNVETQMIYPLATGNSVTRCDGHICVGGYETTPEFKKIATLWIDGVPQHLQTDREFLDESFVEEVFTYDKDLYVMTYERIVIPNKAAANGRHFIKDDDGDGDEWGDDEGGDEDFDLIDRYVIWMNGVVVATFEGLNISDFTVL